MLFYFINSCTRCSLFHHATDDDKIPQKAARNGRLLSCLSMLPCHFPRHQSPKRWDFLSVLQWPCMDRCKVKNSGRKEIQRPFPAIVLIPQSSQEPLPDHTSLMTVKISATFLVQVFEILSFFQNQKFLFPLAFHQQGPGRYFPPQRFQLLTLQVRVHTVCGIVHHRSHVWNKSIPLENFNIFWINGSYNFIYNEQNERADSR